jgi:hypothetical protein
MRRETQISAPVSRSTRDLLEKYVRATGVKKGHLIETALRHHLQALEELPADVIVQPSLVITRRSGEKLVARLASTRSPIRKLRALMSGDGD